MQISSENLFLLSSSGVLSVEKVIGALCIDNKSDPVSGSRFYMYVNTFFSCGMFTFILHK